MAPELTLDQIDLNSPEAPKQLREYAAKMGERAAQVPELEKKVALLELGIDLSTPKGRAFAATLTSDITDRDAVLAEAKEFDPIIIKGESPAAAPGAPATPAAPVVAPTGSAERAALVDGAQPSGAAVPDVRSQSVDEGRAVIAAGGSEAQGIGALLHTRAVGAMEGQLETLNRDGSRSKLDVPGS
jgi:hypothetical protein